AELKKVYKNFGDKVILKGFDYTFKKGERVGVIGGNGVGKTTFLNILQGIVHPDSGKVNIGDTVIFGNYSQLGLPVKEDMRVIEYVKNIAEHFPLADGGFLSAAQFLNLFLFPPEQQYTYISKLSGGEKRRLHLLAILFRNPNFLVLDEPTNDLDLPTLGILENFLNDYQGCLVIVSHDRYFMDRLVDHLLVMEGDGVVRDFPGNYSQYREWLKDNPSIAEALAKAIPVAVTEPLSKPTPGAEGLSKPTPDTEPLSNAAKRRLSYKEKREFESLYEEIQQLTREKAAITDQLTSGTAPFDELQRLSIRVGEISQLLDDKELRWLELSEIAEG
ncbi:MAG TPA: ATP-binding cassette domain-containing protein, partial [Puia sp.]|nr:ATP-binding cassette domain-containing protein [Puia sp.]